MRHWAVRVDYEQGTVSYFVDGALLCEHHAIAARDLHDGPGTWTLGKKQPDDFRLKAVAMQRVLMYDRALTDKEVLSLGSDGRFKQCSDPGAKGIDQTVVDDFIWKDRYGNGCEWYMDHATENNNMCGTLAQRYCPIACAVMCCAGVCVCDVLRWAPGGFGFTQSHDRTSTVATLL